MNKKSKEVSRSQTITNNRSDGITGHEIYEYK